MNSQLLSQLKELIRPFKVKLLRMAGRVLIHAVQEADLEQTRLLVVTGLAGEELDQIRQMQEYGFCSAAPEGSEGFVVCPMGERKAGVVIATECPACRPKDLAEGDVAIFTAADAEGEGEPPKHRIHLVREDGSIIATCTKLVFNAGTDIEFNTEGGGVQFNSSEPIRLQSDMFISLESASILFGPPGNQFQLYGPEGRMVAMIDEDCARVETGSSAGDWPLKRDCGGA